MASLFSAAMAGIAVPALAQLAAVPSPVSPGGVEAVPSPVYSGAVDADAVAQAFVSGCLLTEGHATAVTDWALGQGYAPVDPLRELAAQSLLKGQAGTVLAMPDSGGAVLLVAAVDGRCTVWADKQSGPEVQLALRRQLAALAGQGARLRVEVDRQIEVAGVWRHHLQWRVRRTGSAQDLAVAAVCTLGEAPGTQALNLAPARAGPAFDPDGVPLR